MSKHFQSLVSSDIQINDFKNGLLTGSSEIFFSQQKTGFICKLVACSCVDKTLSLNARRRQIVKRKFSIVFFNIYFIDDKRIVVRNNVTVASAYRVTSPLISSKLEFYKTKSNLLIKACKQDSHCKDRSKVGYLTYFVCWVVDRNTESIPYFIRMILDLYCSRFCNSVVGIFWIKCQESFSIHLNWNFVIEVGFLFI